MTNAVSTQDNQQAVAPTPEISAIEQAVYQGDLSKLTQEQRVTYVNEICRSVGLNPLTRPMEYITLQGKLTLYVTRSGTDQLRQLHGVSIIGLDSEETEDLYIVTAVAQDQDGRTDTARGIVALKDKQGQRVTGEDYANSILKCETKAKRRVTLSICGLGWLDESETSGGSSPPPQRDIEPPRAITEPSAEVSDYANVETGELYEAPEEDDTAQDPWSHVTTLMKQQNVTSSQVKRATGMTFTREGLTEYLSRNPSETPESIVEAAAAS